MVKAMAVFSMNDTARKIKEMRLKKNMTQMELADALGISFQAVSNWERGGSMPDISKWNEISAVLGCSIDELLGNTKETETIKNILQEGPDNADISMKDLADVAELIKPDQTQKMVEKQLQKEEKVNIKELVRLAPFLGESFLDGLAEKVSEVKGIQEIIGLAPFLSEKALDSLAEKVSEVKGIQEIVGLAPFLSENTLEKLVDNILEKEGAEGIDGITGLAPFLNEETLDKLASAALKQDNGPEELSGLYPFLSRKTLEKLAEEIVAKKGVSGLKNIAPFI